MKVIENACNENTVQEKDYGAMMTRWFGAPCQFQLSPRSFTVTVLIPQWLTCLLSPPCEAAIGLNTTPRNVILGIAIIIKRIPQGVVRH